MHASARARLASATIVLTSKRHSTTRPSPRPARLAPLIMASSGGYLTKSKQADERRGPDTIPGLYKTIWGQQRLTQQYPRLTTNTNADVCVVGGGIAGVAVAYELARNGVQVVLLESRVVGGGQTGRDFGHVSHWHDDWYSELASMFGRTTARTAATSQAAAVAWVRDTVAREHIQCGFREVPTVLFAADEDDASLRRLRREREACRLVGLDDAQAQAWGFKAPADKAGGVEDIRLGVNQCLVLGGSAQLDPLQFVHGLADAVVRHGGRIHERTRVTNYCYRTATVTTDDGMRVAAQHVCLATNVPINRDLTLHTGRVTARKRYAVALPLSAPLPPALYHTTEPAPHTVRVVGNALLVGGEYHASGQFVHHYKDYHGAVEAWARARFPCGEGRLAQWSVQVMEPVDKLGLYGESALSSGRHKVWIATGDSGQPMTGGALAAMTIAGSILNRPPSFASLYAPTRVPPLTSWQVLSHWTQEAVNVGVNYGEAVLPKGPGDIEDLAPGSGCVTQRGLRKVAAYRDEEGGLHTFSAICPHMFCQVRWNPVDTTFDCSCHGSQFDRYGRVFNGPSTADLPRLE